MIQNPIQIPTCSQQPNDSLQINQTNEQTASIEEQQWNEVTGKRLRSSPEMPRSNKRQTKLGEYWLSKPITTQNQFEALSSIDESDNLEDTVKNTDAKPKAPPIFVSGVQICKPLIDLLQQVEENDFITKAINS